ncbi:MAG: 4-hydroxythreonine-4-phosphate dehydrogenase PdxA, partial [Anaerolineae bacterium]
MCKRPIVGITMGDPAGIGPEVAAKALARNAVWRCCRALVIGDAGVMIEAVKLVEMAATVHAIANPAAADFELGVLDVLDLATVDLAALRPGRVSASAGRAAVDYVEKATELAQHGDVNAVVTGPINKAALRAAGIPHIGHTELLASLTGQERATTMLTTPGLRVTHVTRHVPLAAVAPLITRERVLSTIRATNTGLKDLGTARPRLAV